MSYADKVFVAMCQDILENGTSTEGELVRPHMGGRHKRLYNKEVWCRQQI